MNPPCKGGCGHTIRPRKTSVAAYPGTREDNGHGYCRTCKALKNAKETPLATCPGCKRELRPQGTHLEHFPGTVAIGGGGYCHTCYCCIRDGRPFPAADGETWHKPLPEDVEGNAELHTSALNYWLNTRRARIAKHTRTPAQAA